MSLGMIKYLYCRQEVLSNGTLVIRNAVNEDAGRYSCVVTGRQGQTAASHTFLHVLSESFFFIFLGLLTKLLSLWQFTE